MNQQIVNKNKANDIKNIFVETFKKYAKNYWWKLLIIAFLLVVDIVTKSLIVKFDTNGNVISNQLPIINGVLYIWPTANEGAAWSILYGKTILLIIMTVVFLVMIVIYDLCFKKRSIFFGIATGMIVAGALGNLFDRIVFGKVRDFIYFSPINFPVFNFADICLTVGIMLFAIYMIVSMIKEKHNETLSQQTDNSAKKNLDSTTNNDNINNNMYQNEMKENVKNKFDTVSQNNIGDNDAKDNS